MFFKINGNDYSMYVNKLLVTKEHNYKSQVTAAGNTVVKYVNSKRTLDVGIIPLNDEAMKNLLTDINMFQVSVSFRNPETNELAENVACIIPNNKVEYYTIQADNVSYRAFSFQIKEL